MERYDRNRHYEDGYDNENRFGNDWDSRQYRNLDEQFERHYQNSHPGDNSGNFYRDSAYERDDNYNRFHSNEGRDYNTHQNEGNEDFRSYRSRDYDMERNYYDNTRGDQGNLGDIRQGYGISGFSGTSDRYGTASDMQRERNAQFEQGYGAGRLGGYSGSGFGGANYSATGGFGGSSDYGSMSGGGGNMDEYVSSSGYGGGDSSSYSDRGVPNYSARNFGDDYTIGTSSDHGGRHDSEGDTYGSGGSWDNRNYGRYAANADRGGYSYNDPNRDSGNEYR